MLMEQYYYTNELEIELRMRAEDLTKPIEDFIVLQRLARAVVEGKFATTFPTQKLLALSSDTSLHSLI